MHHEAINAEPRPFPIAEGQGVELKVKRNQPCKAAHVYPDPLNGSHGLGDQPYEMPLARICLGQTEKPRCQ